MKTRKGYLPSALPQRGSREACPWCGKEPANQHSLREAGECDRKRFLALEALRTGTDRGAS